MVTEEKVTIPDGMMSLQEGTCLAAATIIRKKSKSGQLTLPEEILVELTRQGLLKSEDSDKGSQFEAILKHTIEKNEDLKNIYNRESIPHYYSVEYMTEKYANILIQKGEDSLPLMAEIIRENSKIYPRPIPLDIFREPPFDLTREEILLYIKKMAEQKEYQDINQTTTSIGTVFLYSTLYLDPNYATSLAEWIDVGQVNNP
ncbi:MAG: hypothetical protein MUP27_02590 [Desulfobacterales bacterium]|nr:hypothetical protein [Desulfobacterales bacterium]